MSFFARIIAALRNLFTRKQREEEWAARFTNPPTNKTPLDPNQPWMT